MHNQIIQGSAILPHLARHNPYLTDDIDAACAHISSLFKPHKLAVTGSHQVVDVRISTAEIEGVSIVYHRHGAAVSVRPHQARLRNFYLLQIPLKGEAFVKVDKEEVHCHPRQAVMISPTLPVELDFGKGCEQLIVRIEKTDIERHVERELGYPIEMPVEFVPAVPLTSPPAREITNLLQYMTSTLTKSGGICRSVEARKHLASLLISGLTSCLDHNYYDEMAHGANGARPVYISRAIQFVNNNLRESVGPGDIARAAGVSTRALFSGFRTHMNTTPMRYLKDRRLDTVNRKLSSYGPGQTTVTDIAMKYGFEHLGHFSDAYKKKFGEMPRDTLFYSVL